MTFFFSSYSKFQFILKRWIWLSIICSWFDVRPFGKSFADLRLCNGGHILAVGPSQLVFLRKDNFHFHVFRRTFKISFAWFLFLQYLVFWYFWTRTISSFPYPECGPKIGNAAYILWLYRFCNCLPSPICTRTAESSEYIDAAAPVPLRFPCRGRRAKGAECSTAPFWLALQKIALSTPSFQEILLRNNTVNVFMLAESRVPHTMLVFLLKAAC